ncbi:hypothetical protein HYG82_22630 (plasmid) [Natrinema halophilum]|nr:hypothetical protein HYG82_22630 [Natrinema halophilum]
MTNIDVNSEEVAMGRRVAVQFVDTEDENVSIPIFVPREGGAKPGSTSPTNGRVDEMPGDTTDTDATIRYLAGKSIDFRSSDNRRSKQASCQSPSVTGV